MRIFQQYKKLLIAKTKNKNTKTKLKAHEQNNTKERRGKLRTSPIKRMRDQILRKGDHPMLTMTIYTGDNHDSHNIRKPISGQLS